MKKTYSQIWGPYNRAQQRGFLATIGHATSIQRAFVAIREWAFAELSVDKPGKPRVLGLEINKCLLTSPRLDALRSLLPR